MHIVYEDIFTILILKCLYHQIDSIFQIFLTILFHKPELLVQSD